MNYFCCTERRRNAIRRHPTKNGIDFIEVQDDPNSPIAERQTTLLLHFIKPLSLDALTVENISIQGGERIKNIEVVEVMPMTLIDATTSDKVLWIKVAAAGDFSNYTLRLINNQKRSETDEQQVNIFDVFDKPLSKVDFSFKVTCSNDFDCETNQIHTTQTPPLPQINYLAKDYASFRQLMLDRMALLMPEWRERNPADLGMTLVELLSYTADYLSYRQDAIATEAYLGTARKRISVRRHARLVDYHMHDGCNARAWIHFEVGDMNGYILKKGEGTNTTKILTKTEGLPTVVEMDSSKFSQALNAGAKVFELIHDVKLYAQHNEVQFYTWGEEDCCLPKGATTATLKKGNKDLQLKEGDFLLLEEVMGAEIEVAKDADNNHRHVVRLTKVGKAEEDVDVEYYSNFVATDDQDTSSDNKTISIIEIEWDIADALPFSLCISRNGRANISVAKGNIALVDHGMTIRDQQDSSLLPATVPPSTLKLAKTKTSTSTSCGNAVATPIPPRFYPQLQYSPITYKTSVKVIEEVVESEKMLNLGMQDANQQPQTAAALLQSSVRTALPAISLWEAAAEEETDVEALKWFPRRNLLIDSAENDPHFVLEVERDGTTFLRFGNNKNGMHPKSNTHFKSEYRIGNGISGNVGAESLTHIVTTDAAALKDLKAIRNPLPAQGGKEGETIEEVKQYAPQAFRTKERAVTPSDYETFAKQCKPDIQRAAATFRWTGSWRTASVTVDRLGGLAVDADYEEELRQCLEQYRMAGFDLEIDAPIYVPLEIAMEVCVLPQFFASDIQQVLLELFSNKILADGRRGVFHPDNFSFGQSVYLSRIYAAAQQIQGIDSVRITTFQRQETPSEEAVESGKLVLGRREIARLDNDPNFPGHGLFNLSMKGGR